MGVPAKQLNVFQPNGLLLREEDNVAICTSPKGVSSGEDFIFSAVFPPIRLSQHIPRGHKVAVRQIKTGEPILKFGTSIGTASKDIEAGEHVHNHNIAVLDAKAAESSIGKLLKRHPIPKGLPTHFMGYKRQGAVAGVRNHIVVVATVNCSATVVKAICRHFLNKGLGKIDSVIPVTDPAGCTQEIGGEYHQSLNQTIAGWIFHPNTVGAVIVGLGCEGTTYDSLMKMGRQEFSHPIPIKKLGIQEVGGTAKTIEEGIKAVNEILESLPRFERTEIPVSELRVALNCGGSDSFSAIIANPALGIASDWIVERGGTVALAEIPECHGAESLLLGRIEDREEKEKLKRIFAWWKNYSGRHGLSLNHNLAVGNLAGGISTIIEKSIGAVSKAGSSPLKQVVDFSEPITKNGFVLMNTPGYDPVSVTGLVAGGCQVVVFTTGRGSVFGCSLSPTLKVATTSELFKRMNGDMDIDAGTGLVTGEITGVAETIYRSIVKVAGGEKPCSERLGLGWEEFLPWPKGEMF